MAIRSFSLDLFTSAMIAGLLAAPTYAQSTTPEGIFLRPQPSLLPITLQNTAFQLAANPVGNPSIISTDQTPTHIGDERELLSSPWKATILEKLPARMYFSSVTEVSQRFESNVLSTVNNPHRDYVFRALPNVTLGYNLLPKTSVYANYFVVKDVFANTAFLNPITFQSVSGGIQHDIALGKKTNLQLNYQIRQLFQGRGVNQADMIPGLTLTHYFSPRFIGFFNSQLQMRSHYIFQGPTREIDPFYTLGLLYRKGDWSFTSTCTMVNNFRNRHAIPPTPNSSIICDFEAARPVSRKRLPGLDAFVRAEPIWNTQSHSAPGLSGFDFRIFGGVRYTLYKPSVYPQMKALEKQLKEKEQEQQP